MKKKVAKCLLLLAFIVIVIIAIVNIYKWVVCGNQYITISTSNKAFANSDLSVSVIAQENGAYLETETKITLLDSDGKKVKNAEVSYDGNNATIKVPDVEAGNYLIEAKVSSEAGKDTVEKQIYIAGGNQENVTITLDKGIYKPGDTVNFRALLTNKDNDAPVQKEANICIYDGNDNKVYNETVNASEYGIMSGTFTLADEVNSGIYKLVVKTNTNETTKQFKVNPYVTPKYEIKVDFDKESYLVGDTAKISLSADYFFGEPVSNAQYTVYINDEKYKDVVAGEDGKASVEYKIPEAKEYTVKVEATDSSNYFAEETGSFAAGTDLFEIELLPEYGKLVSGKQNNVYVFTKDAEGKPVKAYVTITSNEFTKQIATDDNGVGMFTIDIGNLTNVDSNGRFIIQSNDYNSKVFNITAENMDGETVQKSMYLSVESRDLLLSTDKVKYEQGEDIKLNVTSSIGNTKNIYFFKNDKLLKMISTDSSDTTINLGDVYGVVDVYVTSQNGNVMSDFTTSSSVDLSNSYRPTTNTNSYKRTIFIKPAKALNIAINTDKQEYAPGDNISISFGTTDEGGNSVDSALLVSMLDNSVLNLADNDISIDNIKLALSDISFSNELDAATLYSCIVDDNSEQTMMGLLLKQNSRDVNISETRLSNSDEKENSAITAVLLIIDIAIIVLLYLCVKFPKFRNVMKHILNVVILAAATSILVVSIAEAISWRVVNDYGWWFVGITSAACLIVYILWLSKLEKKISRTSISVLLTTIILILSIFLITVFDINIFILILIAVLIILALVILAKINEHKKLKIDKYVRKIGNEVIYICKYIGAFVISAIIGALVQGIIGIYPIAVPITIVGTYFFNYLFNKVGKEEKLETAAQTKTNRPYSLYILVALALVGVIAIGYFIINAMAQTATLGGDIMDSTDMSEPSIGYGSDIADDLFSSSSADTSQSASGSDGISSIIQGAEDFLAGREENSTIGSQEVTEEETSTTEVETVVDDNIRNVFLESMCFVPELVTSNGNAKLDLELSDNITTWTIQTVGNTKDGKVGYGVLDNVRVFKEFFVDFELPTNLIKGDKVSIPVTVYNYTDRELTTTLKITEADWFTLRGDNNIRVTIDPEKTEMVYVPITITETGSQKFRVEASNNSVEDIVEKELNISPKGYKVEKVVSTGNLENDVSEDILILDDIVENTGSAKIKIYASTMAQTIEGMENIFRMPTGCFEQISSSLYPNILALKYLEDNGIVNEELKTKAMNYISSGYQKLLTYEVKGESGGYSLYGRSPAETVLTAYGLMQLTDLKEVYNVDEAVISKMTDFLYGKQNANGSFTITGYNVAGLGTREGFALNAYITWALSESDPSNEKLARSIEYLKGELDNVDDNYTLALIANALANVEDSTATDVLNRLVNNINIDGNNGYITSSVRDYYGSRGNAQTIQTTALTSIALSKTSTNMDANKLLVNYLISQKDTQGTWYSTQATIMALKAINELNEKNNLENQTITVRVNEEEQKIEIKDNPLEYYIVTFSNLGKENKLNIDIEKGSAYYEVVEEYYIPYEKVETAEDKLEVTVEADGNLKVNDILEANIKVVNRSDEAIYNGMVTINIPQGFTVQEESLMELETSGKIEKYEMSYTTINLYLRDFAVSQMLDLDIEFRAAYPVDVTGLSVRAYDYYNPEIEGKAMPMNIVVED